MFKRFGAGRASLRPMLGRSERSGSEGLSAWRNLIETASPSRTRTAYLCFAAAPSVVAILHAMESLDVHVKTE